MPERVRRLTMIERVAATPTRISDSTRATFTLRRGGADSRITPELSCGAARAGLRTAYAGRPPRQLQRKVRQRGQGVDRSKVSVLGKLNAFLSSHDALCSLKAGAGLGEIRKA
jgi:hypothetical protein